MTVRTRLSVLCVAGVALCYGASWLIAFRPSKPAAGMWAPALSAWMTQPPTGWPKRSDQGFRVLTQQRSGLGWTLHRSVATTDLYGGKRYVWQRVRFGLPLWCVESDLRFEYQTAATGVPVGAPKVVSNMYMSGLELSPPPITSADPGTHLPLKPLPLFMVINIAIFIAIAELSRWAWRKAGAQERGRLKLCVSCGYPRATRDDRCPECGHTPAAKNRSGEAKPSSNELTHTN